MSESVEQAMRSAKASLQVEGLAVTEKHTDLVRQVLRGKITEEEFHRRAWEYVQQKK